MEAEAKRVGEELGLAWIRPIASNYTHSAAAGLYRVILPQPDLTEEQLARLEAIAQRQEVIAEEMDDESIDEDAYKALDQERSEEHTSELQSLMRISYAVFCLKKKRKKTI